MALFKLRDDQIASLAFAISNPKGMNLSDPGTGKTPPTCVNQWRRVEEGVGRTIWVQPKSLMPKNVIEITRFTPWSKKDVAIIDGTPAQVDRAMRANPQVMLMGPDRFKLMMQAGQIPPDVKSLDVDEFHMCFGGAGSGPQGKPSKRTEAFYQFMERATDSIFMTGTLVNGRLDTAFPAIHAVEPRYYPFGYEQFLGAHAYLDDYGRPYAWHDHEKLREILGRHAIRFTFESVFGKQEVVKEVQWLALNDTQKSIYRDFERDAMYELEKFMIDGTLPGVATTRARQIMEHPNDFPDLRDPENLPRVDITPGERPAKLDALEIHFEDHKRLGTPVIVFAAYKPQMRQISELACSMGLRSEVMNGDTKAADKDRIDRSFVAGGIDALVASPPVASVGFNWQDWASLETDHVIFASLTYKDSDFIQGYRRTIRRKRVKPLRVTTLGYLDSLDNRLMSILERKSRDANLVDPTQELLRFNNHEEIAN
ncbi:MAG: helicase-related protein [Caulobacteraceae bacterium]